MFNEDFMDAKIADMKFSYYRVACPGIKYKN